MKRLALNFTLIALAAFLSLPSFAQDEKEKEKEKKKGAEQIIITKKDGDEKVIIEINGDKVTINGKPADEYKEGEVKVLRNKIKTYEGLNSFSYSHPGAESWNFNWNDDAFGSFMTVDDNRAMLGVVTEETDQGAKVTDITSESAAKKAGIKEGDVITKIDEIKVGTPDDLSKAVRKHKPGDKVTVTFLRDKKEQKVTAELGKWKGTTTVKAMPRVPEMKMMETMPRTPYYGQNSWNWSGGSPKLGLSVQDTDDAKGVKVIEVDDESNAAKAGIKEDDIITHINEKAVNSTDEVVKIIKESKDKVSIQLKVKRGTKIQNIEVKMPRKIKTTDL